MGNRQGHPNRSSAPTDPTPVPMEGCKRQNPYLGSTNHTSNSSEVSCHISASSPSKTWFSLPLDCSKLQAVKAWETQTFGEQVCVWAKPGPQLVEPSPRAVSEWHWAVLPMGPSSLRRQPPLCPPLPSFAPPPLLRHSPPPPTL